jgi:delta1-piperideine-2-carboxylate reductase
MSQSSSGRSSSHADADSTFIPIEQLTGLLARIFVRYGTSPEVAAILARNCAAAEVDGATSHGIFRMPGYVATLRSGWVDGKATPVIAAEGAAFIAIDAANGFAQPALELARPHLIAKAKSAGVAMAAIRHSHHFGALWADVEPLANEGLVAIAFVNAIARVVPFGGTKPVFGTNPMAFAVPRAGHLPLVFDQASSAMSNGDIRLAAREGRAVPEGSGVDRQGRVTTDPKAIVDGGALLPFGGHKGSSIALMIEILAAAVTGGQFSFEVDRSGHPGAETPRTGELVLAIDPSKSAGTSFAARIETLLGELADAGQTRLPGDRRYRQRARSRSEGVRLRRSSLRALEAMLAE